MRVPVVLRAYRATAAERARHARDRAREHRHALTSAALIAAGLGGALAGGALVGEWCLGLVLIAESGGAVFFGLFRDDGRVPPVPGERTPAQVLDWARRLP
jgi:hypothetical protein